MNNRLPTAVLGIASSVLLAACASTGYSDRYDAYSYDTYDRYDTRDSRYYDSRYDNRYDNRRCDRCGQVVDIERFYGEGRASGAGAVGGAIVGGVLGSQVGSGSGRDAATVAGAIAGGVAGHNIEQNAREGERYAIHVQLDNGRRVVVEQRDLNGVREGSRVIIDDGRARLI